MRIPHLIATLFLSACTVSVPPAAQAAQSYDNCAHFIDTLPAVIDQQWTDNLNAERRCSSSGCGPSRTSCTC